MLEFYFRFRSRSFRRNLHVILHQAAEFGPNRTIRRWNMTSYPFLKMAAVSHVVFTLRQWRTTYEVPVPFVIWILSWNREFVGLIVPEILRCKNFSFWFETAYSHPFLGSFWGIFSPYDVTHRPDPKRTVLGRKHVIWAIRRNYQCDGSTWG